ncbi:hypothetical protein HYV71_01660 [Candidatus Uhrbacteria bacterium]|nr:hypothetical protein [Candidatus Uhrbacteria bacterium]
MTKKILLTASIIVAVLLPSFPLDPAPPAYATAPLKSEKSKIPDDYYFRFPIGDVTKVTAAEFQQGKALPNYITGVYKWMVGVVAILAVIALMVGGVIWILAGGSKGRIDQAKKTITNAIVGLLLALGSYLFLWTISPNLVQFRPLDIAQVAEIKVAISKSCDSICRSVASSRGANLVGSVARDSKDKCVPGTETTKTPTYKQVCVEDDGQTCLCDFITRSKGDKNCLTPGLECPGSLFCDPIKNECVDKKAPDAQCGKDIECQDGYSCLPDPSDPTNKSKFSCKPDTKTTLAGMCCYVGYEKDPADAYTDIPKALQEPQKYRECQNRETREVRGTYTTSDTWVWCESPSPICSKVIPVLPSGSKWSFDFNFMKSQNKNCFLFRRGNPPHQFSPPDSP